MSTYPDDNKHDHNYQRSQYGSFEPQLAVLQVQAHSGHLAHEIRLTSELLTCNGTQRSAEGCIGADESKECAKGEVGNGVITIEAYEGGYALGMTAEETDVSKVPG